jgi:hypothetical protein
LEICSVHGAAIPIHDDIMFPTDLDHTIQFRIGEYIISRDEFDVGIAVYGHVVGNRDPGLGCQEQRKKSQEGTDCFHNGLNLKQAKLQRKVTKSQG